MCYKPIDGEQNHDLVRHGGGARYRPDEPFRPIVHSRELGGESMSAGLLRKQGLLRNFAKAGSDFSATREKRVGSRVERDLCCNGSLGVPGLFFVRSTSFFRAHVIVRDCTTAARGPLHVSYLILGR